MSIQNKKKRADLFEQMSKKHARKISLAEIKKELAQRYEEKNF